MAWILLSNALKQINKQTKTTLQKDTPWVSGHELQTLLEVFLCRLDMRYNCLWRYNQYRQLHATQSLLTDKWGFHRTKMHKSLFKRIHTSKVVSVLPEVWIFVQDIVWYVCQPYFNTQVLWTWLWNTAGACFYAACIRHPDVAAAWSHKGGGVGHREERLWWMNRGTVGIGECEPLADTRWTVTSLPPSTHQPLWD